MHDIGDLGDMLHDVAEQVVDFEDARDAEKFAKLGEDSIKPLYPGSKAEHTVLSVVLQLLKFKATYNWPDTSFTKLLAYLAAIFLEGNFLPTSTYRAKKVVCPLALDVQRFEACPNDCVIYHKTYEKLKKCPVCNTSWYKCPRGEEHDDEEVPSGSPAKVVWYLPILPRLKHFFEIRRTQS